MKINRFQQLKIFYGIALTFIALTLLSSSILMQRAVQRNEGVARVINLSGRQRMLSQRLTKCVLAVERTSDGAERAKRIHEISKSLTAWKAAHLGLQHGDEKLGLSPRQNSAAIMALFSEMEPLHANMVHALEQLIAQVEGGSLSPDAVHATAEVLLRNEPIFLELMDKITFQFDREAKERIGELQSLEQGSLYAGLMVLVLEFLFVFRPSLSQLAQMMNALQRRAQEAQSVNAQLREREERLKEADGLANQKAALLKSIMESPHGVVIFSLDRAYRYTEFTQSHQETIRKIWGAEIGVGMNLLNIISDPDDRENAKRNFDRALQGEHLLVVEEYGDRSLHRTFYENRYSPILDMDGAVLGLTVFAIDITERKQAEEMLARERLLLSSLKKNIPDTVFVKDRESRFLWINEAKARLHGCANEEALIGKTDRDLFAPEHFHNSYAIEQRIMATGRSIVDEEERVIWPDGHVSWVSTTKAPLIDATGDIVGILGISSDITERKRTEEALKKRMVALTQPLDNTAALQFSDLFDIDDIQRLQDQFANATGVASIITAPDGTPITKDSNFTRLCFEVIRGVEKGLCNCFKSDAALGKHCPSGPIVQRCLSGGLWDAGASITVGGKHVASWLIGQVRNEAQDDESMLRYADEIGADRATFRQALAEVPVMSQERFEQIAQALFTLAGELSNRAYQNIQQARFIHERKQTEAALRLQSSALEAAANAIVITDTNGMIQWANSALTTITGYTVEESIGKTPKLFKSGKHDQTFYKNLWDTVLAGKVWHGEMINRRKDGCLYPEETTITPMKDNSGEVTHFIAVKQDITERKAMEEKFLRTQRMESIGTLAAGVAHDLNNILTPIILSTEMLRTAQDPGTRECLMESIQECAKRGADMVDQVLIFVRGAKGERTTLEWTRIVKDMEKMMNETFPRNITISSSIPSDLWPVVGNPTQIHQVLLNLCINARDAMPSGGALLISAENAEIDESFAAMVPFAKAGHFAMLTVSDTGTGIPHEITGKIFEPFFTTKELGKGTGLGLSSVAGIVRSHGGFVTVESEVGRGTTFKVFLPRDTQGATEQKPLSTKKIPQDSGGATILVVDDEASIAKTLSMVLKNDGYKVLTAFNGNEALALYKEHANEINLVLTDVMMPGMDGVELTRALQEIDPLLKIIASTGQASESRQDELHALGVNVILHKPYNAKKLLASLHDSIHAERT